MKTYLKPMLETQYKFNKIYLLILTLEFSKKRVLILK